MSFATQEDKHASDDISYGSGSTKLDRNGAQTSLNLG